ncbi:serine hydrolase domain-containing protein [Jiulongibacter sp. NS-SX5]|uniref:serine hydrolase domain-containing protein n=1 Tax=Jiulongibacter sp. NS-SX5 TaxID=3463854 RepID=UPI00405A1F53
MKTILFFFIGLGLIACGRISDLGPEESINYFPGESDWSSQDPKSLGITGSELSEIRDFMKTSDTRAFLLLKDGKLVIEEYQGEDLLGLQDFGKESQWYWASAGKTLTSFLVGLAQEQGYLNIDNKTSEYLGEGWTSMPLEKENLITVKHQLTMTSGMDIEVDDPFCTEPKCFAYLADAGTRWEYHNGPYTILDEVITSATNQDFDSFFNENLRDKIGMDGKWRYVENNHVYFSTARSMARFGLMILNDGKWGEEQIMQDKSYLNAMKNTSQGINEAYGYLWWLNGKETGMVPGYQTVFNRWLTPDAPQDMISALGLNGQILNIIPSENMIVIRMGANPTTSQVGLNTQDEIWALLNKVMD